MENRVCNQEDRRRINTKQNTERGRGDIGDRSSSLTELIGVERVSRRDYKYEGTYYMTKNGEVYDNEYMNSHNPYRTGVNFYEVIDWEYNEERKRYQPTIRRVVMIQMREYQLSLNL